MAKWLFSNRGWLNFHRRWRRHSNLQGLWPRHPLARSAQVFDAWGGRVQDAMVENWKNWLNNWLSSKHFMAHQHHSTWKFVIYSLISLECQSWWWDGHTPIYIIYNTWYIYIHDILTIAHVGMDQSLKHHIFWIHKHIPFVITILMLTRVPWPLWRHQTMIHCNCQVGFG